MTAGTPVTRVALQDDRGHDADDAAILVASRLDSELFAEIYRRHAPALRRYVTRRLGVALAEDIVADTFLLAFRQRESYDSRWVSARPWLYGIASNLIGRHRRAEVRQYRAYARTGVDPVTAPFADAADSRVSAGALKQTLARALAQPSGARTRRRDGARHPARR